MNGTKTTTIAAASAQAAERRARAQHALKYLPRDALCAEFLEIVLLIAGPLRKARRQCERCPSYRPARHSACPGENESAPRPRAHFRRGHNPIRATAGAP